MRRNIGQLQYLHIRTATAVDDEDTVTFFMPGCTMFRVKLTSVASGASLLYRGVEELVTPDAYGPDPDDTGALDADFCDVLTEDVADSGWIDAQVSGIRIEGVTGLTTVKVMWTSRFKPAIA